jgi:uncharacterized membrane protein
MTTRTTPLRRGLGLVAAAIAVGAVSVMPASADMPRAGTGTTTQGTTPTIRFPGFLLDKGRYTTFQIPGAATETLPGGIDDHGRIVGEYNDATGEHGFLRDRRGRLTRFDVPGALATAPTRINNSGQIVGAYSELSRNLKDPGSMPRGFLLDDGRLTRIDVAGALYTQAIGLNDRGQVVGDYSDRDGTVHGYLWRKGRFTTIDFPGAIGTETLDINDSGQIVGYYADRGGSLHGFLRDGRGRFTTIDAPGALLTAPYGINDHGRIVGTMSTDPSGLPARGFVLRKGADGPLTPIDVPGAPSTFPFDINNRGRVVGFYENANVATSARRRRTMPTPRLDVLRLGLADRAEIR